MTSSYLADWRERVEAAITENVMVERVYFPGGGEDPWEDRVTGIAEAADQIIALLSVEGGLGSSVAGLPSSEEASDPLDLAKLEEVARAASEGPWFAGPLQPEDECGGPGGVSVGPYDIAAKFGGRDDYSPERFNDHYEDQIALVSGCNHDAEANARHIATFDPPTVLRLIELTKGVKPPADTPNPDLETINGRLA